ncbi:MAG: hypothetical protein EOP07_11540 [Proteobacteria bacterium]|nr:MAG: hypothetical protein EOP07_11540 [Pseudomonadota bacterium]
MTESIWKRRDFVISTFLTGAWFATGCHTLSGGSTLEDQGPAMPGRSNWNDLDASLKDKYRTAVSWFKANDKQKYPASDPRSFLTWKKLASVHAQSCQHMNNLFLPWHRLYLNYFENACRYALGDASFMLPYWDFADKAFPDEFFAMTDLQSKRKITKGGRIPQEFVNQKLMKRLLTLNDFYAFHSGVSPTVFAQSDMMTSLLEGSAHNAVHTNVGGEMLGSNAPLDPIFWLVHANIDRIWATWALQNSNAVIPPEPALGVHGASKQWLETTVELSFNDRPGDAKKSLAKLLPDLPEGPHNARASARMKVKDLISTRNLHYSYDSLIGAKKVVNAVDFNRRNERLIDGISRVENNVLLSNLTVNEEVAGRLKDLNDPNNHASLLVLNVPIIPDPEVSNRTILRFFAFNAEELTLAAANELRGPLAVQRPDYLGSYNFLIQGHVHHEQVSQGTIHLNLDITEWLKKRGDFKKLTLLMVALDTGQSHAIVNLFGDIETEMKIQYSTLD